MGQAWCKEKSSKAQDSKSPLDRVFLRCAHTIYPGLKEEGSVLGGATQRVTSSEIGYAGSPPRGALTRGRSIDSVDRPFHPSEWVDVNLEVPGTPRTSALTNLTGHAKLYSASTTAISTGSNKGRNEVPVPPPRQKRKKVTQAGRPLPPKPDDEHFRENLINNNNNNIGSGISNNNRNVNNKARPDCVIKDDRNEDLKSLESCNEEDPLYSSVKSVKSNSANCGDNVKKVVLDDDGDNDNDDDDDDDDDDGDDNEGEGGEERVAKKKSTIITSNSVGISEESNSRCCSTGTKVNANEDVKASTSTSETTTTTPAAITAATAATTTTTPAAAVATTTGLTMTTTLTSTKDVYEHKINGTGKIIPSELVSLRTRRNSDREYEKFCRSHSAQESSTPKKAAAEESVDKSNLDNSNSANYVDLDEILKTKNSARKLTAEMKARSSLDSGRDKTVTEMEEGSLRRSNSKILPDENFSENRKFEKPDIEDKREADGKKDCDPFFLHQPKIVSEMMKSEGEFKVSSFHDQDFPDTPISRISRTISEESLPREMLLEEVEEEPIAERKADLEIEKTRIRRNPFLDENEEKNDSLISEEKIEAEILENDHSVLLKVLKSESQNEDNCNPSNLSSMTPSLHELEADLSDLLEKEEKSNDLPGLGNEGKIDFEDSLDKSVERFEIEPKIVPSEIAKGFGSTRRDFEISEMSKIRDEVDGISGHERETRKNIENSEFEDVDLTENENSGEKVSKFQEDSGERLFHRVGNSNFFIDNEDEEKKKIDFGSKQKEEEGFTGEAIPPEKPSRLHRYNIAEIVPTPPKRKNRSFQKMHCETEENKKDSSSYENDRLI